MQERAFSLRVELCVDVTSPMPILFLGTGLPAPQPQTSPVVLSPLSCRPLSSLSLDLSLVYLGPLGRGLICLLVTPIWSG